MEFLRGQADRSEMAADSFRHDVQRFISEMSAEHLVTFRQILSQLVTNEDWRLVAYYEGVAAGTLHFKYNVCTGCGRDHDAEAMEHMEEASGKGDPQPEVEPRPSDTEEQLILFDIDKNGNQQILSELTPEKFKLMEEYNLDDVRDEDTLKLLGFACKNCGMRYPSIEDRMLREKDDCSGCIQKAKWG